MIHVMIIDIIITTILSFIEFNCSQCINFLIDEKIMSHQELIIINHSVTPSDDVEQINFKAEFIYDAKTFTEFAQVDVVE